MVAVFSPQARLKEIGRPALADAPSAGWTREDIVVCGSDGAVLYWEP